MKKRKYAYVIFCISLLIMGYCLLTYLRMTLYVMPAADDFGFSNEIKKCIMNGQGYLETALELTKEIYLEWEGRFSSDFLMYYTAPFVRMGIKGIKIFCAINIVLFYGSLWIMIYYILKALMKVERNLLLSVFGSMVAIITWLISNARFPMEVFFWYTGICAYTMPISFAMIGISFLIKYIFASGNRKSFWGAILFGFLASGGVLQCTAIICFVYLLMFLWCAYIKHEKRKYVGLAFVIVFLGSLANSLAPGNFVRQTSISNDGLPIFSAFKYSFQNTIGEVVRLILETDMMYLFLIGVGVGVFLSTAKITGKGLMAVFFSIILGMWIACYPVALGYSSDYMEPRGYFVIDVLGIIGFILFSFLLGQYLRDNVKMWFEQCNLAKCLTVCSVLVLCVILNFCIPIRTIQRPLTDAIEDEKNEYLSRFENMWGEIFAKIENSEEQNVVVESKHIPSPAILKNPDLTPDVSYWINQSVADYYDKETVAVIWID